VLSGLLSGSSSSQVVSFVIEMLREPSRRLRAVTVLERRRDGDFVRKLLQTDRLFSNAVLREAWGGVSRIPWLAPYDVSSDRKGDGPSLDVVEVLNEGVNIIRALRLLILSGVGGASVRGILQGLIEIPGPVSSEGDGAGGTWRPGLSSTAFVRESALTTYEALASGRSVREISMALTDTERNLLAESERRRRTERSGARRDEGGKGLSWASSEAVAIPRDAFEQFFEGYDRLDGETKALAGLTLKRLDASLESELREVLLGLDPDLRLKAVKLVAALSREHELQDVLLELVGDPDERVRATVVKALGVLENESAVKALLRAVADFDRRVVANTVEALEATGFSELVGLIRILAGHPNNRIRANAVKALMLLEGGADSVGESTLREMMSSREELMRLSATWVLGEIDHRRRLEWLTRMAREDPSARVRQRASSVLG